VKHLLLRTSAFIRAARKLVKRSPQLAQDLAAALQQLEDDPNHPSLRTHKLKGELKNSFACSAGYDCRIVFRFVRYQGKPAVLLESLGTHDEVY
jgi:mRNA-degrading endonuclease YafQ of YafQ-DinJ toxin-antitoxin module